MNTFKELSNLCLSGSGKGRLAFSGRKNVFSFENLLTKDPLKYQFQLLFPFQNPVLWGFTSIDSNTQYFGDIVSGVDTSQKFTPSEKLVFREVFDFLSDVIIFAQKSGNEECEMKNHSYSQQVSCEGLRPMELIQEDEKIQIVYNRRSADRDLFLSMELSGKVAEGDDANKQVFFRKVILNGVSKFQESEQNITMTLLVNECSQ